MRDSVFERIIRATIFPGKMDLPWEIPPCLAKYRTYARREGELHWQGSPSFLKASSTQKLAHQPRFGAMQDCARSKQGSSQLVLQNQTVNEQLSHKTETAGFGQTRPSPFLRTSHQQATRGRNRSSSVRMFPRETERRQENALKSDGQL